jgi:hypothetical protein
VTDAKGPGGDDAGPLADIDGNKSASVTTIVQVPQQRRRLRASENFDRENSPARVEPIPLACIKDGGAQMRVEMRPETVNDYASDILDGAAFPPVVVFYDGNDYWLGDGFHRVEAARKIGRETIVAEIREGSARDAVLHGIGSNAAHGLRRTQADKRRAVERLLKDPEWARWSDRKIAETAKVDHKTVGAIRRELAGEFPTSKAKGGEIPTANGKPNGKPNGRASLLGDVLHAIPDDVLIAECRRRGLTVEADDA